MTLQGRGFFTFILPECEGGSPSAIVSEAKAAGLSYVVVKIADGPNPFGFSGDVDNTAPVVKALHDAGIAVWGWHYVYGDDPLGEASIAVQRVNALGLDGYVIDAEGEYKQPGKTDAARNFISRLRMGLPRLPVALSSYRFPNLHPELPWSTFLEKCDYNMPQMYWEKSHDAGAQLRESKKQCDALPNARPFVPTASTYTTSDWAPTVEDIDDFLGAARSLELKSISFFSWDACRQFLPELWMAISTSEAPVPSIPSTTPPVTPSIPPSADKQPPLNVPTDGNPKPQPGTSTHNPSPPGTFASQSFTTSYLNCLNNRDPSQCADLYDSTAVSIRSSVVTRGIPAIARDYVDLFAELPGNQKFSLVDDDAAGNIHHITWKIGEHTGRETVVLRSGKIAIEYFFLS